jgi:hypothetical protein
MARPCAAGRTTALAATHGPTSSWEEAMPHAIQTPSAYAAEYDAIVETMQRYIEGSRAGKSDLMRPGFLADATIVGYVGGTMLSGPIQQLYDWIDGNGPAPHIEPRFSSVEMLDTIAVVRLEVERWSGELAGSEVHMSDAFTLVKTEDGWKIAHKIFHWHAQ